MDFPLLKYAPDPDTPTVASDLEGTLTSGSTVRALHYYLERTGRRSASRAIYRRRFFEYVLRKVFRKDLRQVKNNWMRDLMRLFAGSSAEELRQVTDYVTDKSIWPFRHVPVITELNHHLEAGRRVIVVSGMSYPILESLLERLPGMEAIGTHVIGDRSPFSGELGVFNVGKQKVDSLRGFCNGNGKIYAAYGDTFSDLPMLEISENPTAVNPDRRLRKAVEAKSWRILDVNPGETALQS